MTANACFRWWISPDSESKMY